MLEITFITLVGQIILPIALLLCLWRSRSLPRTDRLLRLAATAAFLAMLAVAGVWLLLPWYLPYGYAILGAGAALAPRRAEDAPGTRAGRAAWGLVGLLCAGVVALALHGRGGRGPEALSIAAPLRGGRYLVVNGGASILVNPHLKTLARGALRRYRAQSHAVDIVKLDAAGFRASGLWPSDPGRYHIFGEQVRSPCDGEVIAAENRLPDLSPPMQDSDHPAGNFLYLGCRDDAVVLAHLKQGSLRVGPGERVRAGQVLAQVGNSGRTTEPHLHIHAQRRVPAENFLEAEPIPLRIDGCVPVRNSRLHMGGITP